MKPSHLSSQSRVSTIAVVLCIVIDLLVPSSARATSITLAFSGTYDTDPGQVFGLSGAAVPYNFQITYDTALDTNAFFFPAGVNLGAQTTTHDWYGYSASGITATSLTFGTQTWTTSDLRPRIPAVGVSADLWFDTDISLATPTRSWIFFAPGSPGLGFLELGSGQSDAANIFMTHTSSIVDLPTGSPAVSELMTITEVPEPASLLLLGLGLATLIARRHQKKGDPPF